MNYHTDIVIILLERRAWKRGALIPKILLFEGVLFREGALIGEWALIRSFTVINPKIPFTGINIFQSAFRLLFN